MPDDKKKVEVTVKISALQHEDHLKILRDSIVEARKRVENKNVVLEKLGKARDVVGLLRPAGEAVGDVSTLHLEDCDGLNYDSCSFMRE